MRFENMYKIGLDVVHTRNCHSSMAIVSFIPCLPSPTSECGIS